MENGETDAGAEETWEEKVKPDEEEPGGGPQAESRDPDPESDEGQEDLEEEEELPILKPPPPKPDAPKKEHVNVVFIGHVGEVSLGVLNSLAQHLTPRVDKMSFLNLLCG